MGKWWKITIFWGFYGDLMGINPLDPSGKHTKNDGKSPSLIGKSTN
jgi:hypothetical protein